MKSKRILVVDDEPMVVKALCKRLKDDGHLVVSANDGFEALKIIQNQKLDLVISDIAMPYLNGLELVSYIKSNMIQNMPIILISALEEKELVMAALKLNADEYIVKPVNMTELSLRIRGFINKLREIN